MREAAGEVKEEYTWLMVSPSYRRRDNIRYLSVALQFPARHQPVTSKRFGIRWWVWPTLNDLLLSLSTIIWVLKVYTGKTPCSSPKFVTVFGTKGNVTRGPALDLDVRVSVLSCLLVVRTNNLQHTTLYDQGFSAPRRFPAPTRTSSCRQSTLTRATNTHREQEQDNTMD
jgi:hypothetical protein